MSWSYRPIPGFSNFFFIIGILYFQVVVNFKMPGKVHRTAMSSLASSHMLIAAGTEDVQVRLCDIASGAFTHTLSGHRGMLLLFAQ